VLPKGSISGTVTADTNNDDTGDEMLQGVLIILTNDKGLVISSTATFVNGGYAFLDLTPGRYVVQEINTPTFPFDVKDKDGGNPNCIFVFIGNGNPLVSEGNDFVDEVCREISGSMNEDIDNDDIGDVGIDSVIIELFNDSNQQVATTITNSEGLFEFICVVKPGKFSVIEKNKDGFKDVNDSDDGNPNIVTVGISKKDSLRNEFVDRRLTAAPTVAPSLSPVNITNGSISGSVAGDSNDDDMGDVNLKDILVSLKDFNNQTLATTVTGINGIYSFENLQPGRYFVEETNNAEFPFDVRDKDGDNPNRISVSIGNGLPLVSNGNDFLDELCRDISGIVRNDIDFNRIGDVAIGDVKIELLDDKKALLMTTTTDSLGTFLFSCMQPGKYYVVETNKEGYIDVMDIDGGDPNVIKVNARDSNSENNNFVDMIRTTPPSSSPSDTPSSQPSSIIPGEISGKVSADTNNNDIGDIKIPQVLVALIDKDAKIIATTATDKNGEYIFVDIPPGKYSVVETNRAEYPLDVTSSILTVDLPPGEKSTDNNFVDEVCRRIVGSVQEDTNNDDKGDVPLVGVTLLLFSNIQTLLSTTVSDSTGRFDFGCREPSVSFIEERNPQGITDVSDSDGGNPNKLTVDSSLADSLDNLFVDRQYLFTASIAPTPKPSEILLAPPIDSTLEPSSAPSSIIMMGSISGNASEDIDDDSIGDVDLIGVFITLFDDKNEVIRTTITDSEGNYVFYDLAAGKYFVTETNLIDVPLDVSDKDGGDDLSRIEVILSEAIVLNSTGNDFVDERCRMIGGMVMEDIDDNGTGDVPMKGVVVELRESLISGLSELVGKTTTDTKGNYSFMCVKPGKYTILERTPSKYLDVKVSDGGNPNEITLNITRFDSFSNLFVNRLPSSNPSFAPSASPSGAPSSTILGSISGNVSEDIDNNDAGDVVLEGVLISLLIDGNIVIRTTVTDSLGNYKFIDLSPGTYEVREINRRDVPLYVTDSDGGDFNSIKVLIGNGMSLDSMNNNFVDERCRIVSGFVSEDIDDDEIGELLFFVNVSSSNSVNNSFIDELPSSSPSFSASPSTCPSSKPSLSFNPSFFPQCVAQHKCQPDRIRSWFYIR